VLDNAAFVGGEGTVIDQYLADVTGKESIKQAAANNGSGSGAGYGCVLIASSGASSFSATTGPVSVSIARNTNPIPAYRQRFFDVKRIQLPSGQ
jgi:hypothetical protein